MNRKSRYKIWPYAKVPNKEGQEEFSIPDSVMLGIWQEMVLERKEKVVFFSGGVKTPEEWMSWMKSGFNYPVLVVDVREKKIVFVAWLNSVVDRICFAHFCGIGRNTYVPEIPELVMEYWSSFRNGGHNEPYFKAIFAMIPETNEKAVKLATRAGFQFLGTIPGLCDLVYEGRTVGGTFGYFVPQKGE